MRKLFVFEDKNIDMQFREIVTRAFADLPEYENNGAATEAGLKKDEPYRTPLGQVMVVF
jgi:hypothetical protein